MELFSEVCRFTEKSNFHVGFKIRQNYIYYYKEKIKVKSACQTLALGLNLIILNFVLKFKNLKIL